MRTGLTVKYALCLVIALSLLFGAASLAYAEEPDVRLEFADVYAAPGETVSVMLAHPSINKGWGALQFNLRYADGIAPVLKTDSEGNTVPDVIISSEMAKTKAMVVTNTIKTDRRINVALVCEYLYDKRAGYPDNTWKGDLFSIQFTVPDGTEPGVYMVGSGAVVEVAADCDGQTLDVEIVPGSITVVEASRIAVTTPPAKRAYVDGQALDLTGMVVTYYDENTVAHLLTASDYQTDPQNGAILNTIGDPVNIRISYTPDGATDALTTVCPVTVVAKASSALTVVAEPTLNYVEGTADGFLSLSGLKVKLAYNDGTSEEIAFADFATRGLTVSLDDDTRLTSEHNGDVITVTHTSSGLTADTSALTVTEPQYELQLEASNVSGRPGETVTVQIGHPSYNVGWGAMTFLVDYDEALTLVPDKNPSISEEAKGDGVFGEFGFEGYKIKAVLLDADTNYSVKHGAGTGQLVDIRFEIPEDAMPGSYEISLERVSAGTSSTNELTNTNPVAGSVTVIGNNEIYVTTPPTKTVYVEGQAFDETGMVVTYYDENGLSSDVTDLCAFAPAVFATTDTEVTITYADKNRTTTYPVTVVAKAPTGLTVAAEPKLSYVEGSAADGFLSLDSLEVSLAYNDGTSEEIPFADFATKGYAESLANDTRLTSAHDGDVITITHTATGLTADTSALTVTEPPYELQLEASNVSGRPGETVTVEIGHPSYNIGWGAMTFLVNYNEALTLVPNDEDDPNPSIDEDVPEEGAPILFQFLESGKIKAVLLDANTNYSVKHGDRTGQLVDVRFEIPEDAIPGVYEIGLEIVSVGTSDTNVFTKTNPVPGYVTVIGKNEIYVTTPPTKTAYIEGQPFDRTGMVVTYYDENGNPSVVTEDCTVTPAVLATNDTEVTVTYANQELTTTYPVTVAAKKVASISVTKDPRLSYHVDGTTLPTLDLTGMVVNLTYDNGVTSAEGSTSVTYSATEFAKYGLTTSPADGEELTVAANNGQKITVFCDENIVGETPLTATTEGALSVADKAITQIIVTKEPKTMTYIEGQSLSLDGMELKIHFNDGEVAQNVPIDTALAYPSSYAVVVSPADGTKLTLNEDDTVITVSSKADPTIKNTTTGKLTVNEKQVSSLTVVTQPELSYYVGSKTGRDKLDLDALVIDIEYDNGTKDEGVHFSEFETYGITTAPEDGTTLALTNNNTPVVLTHTATEKATQTGKLSVVELDIASIAVTTDPTDMDYIQGQPLDLTGMVVTRTYNDGATDTVAAADFADADISTDPAGVLNTVIESSEKRKVTAKLTNGLGTQLTAETTGFLTVAAKRIASITVKTSPRLTYYIIKDQDAPTLDLSALVLTLHYDNGVTTDTDDVPFTSFTAREITTNYEDGVTLGEADNEQDITFSCAKDVVEEITDQLIGKLNVTDRAITGIEIVSDPDAANLSYIEGQPLKLDGMTVKLSYNNGTDETVGIATALGYGVETAPASGAALTMDDIDQKIKVSFGTLPPAYTTGKLAVAAKKVERISVTTDPTTMTYFVDGTTLPTLDLTDMVVKLTYDNGVTGAEGSTSVTYSATEFTKYGLTASPVHGGDLTVAANNGQKITVSCDENIVGETPLTATTKGALSVVNKAITAIEVTKDPTKMAYIEAQPLNLDGMLLKLTFNNKEVAENVPIATALAYPYYPVVTDPIDGAVLTQDEDDTAITVSSKANAAIKATTGKLTVAEKQVTGLTVKTQPTLTYYIDSTVGKNKLDLDDMTIDITYDNGTVDEGVPFSEFEARGITTEPTDGTILTGTNHDTPVVLTHTATDETAQTGKLSVVALDVVSIAVTTDPTDMDYIQGQTLDLTGMVVTRTYNDGATDTVAAGFADAGITTTPTGALNTVIELSKKQTVTAKLTNGVGTELTAETTGFLTVVAKRIASITVKTPPTLAYYLIEDQDAPTLDLSALVLTLHYDNGVTTDTDDVPFTSFTAREITTNYEDGVTLGKADNGKDITFSCSKDTVADITNQLIGKLNVTDRAITGIEIVSDPDVANLSYIEGQPLKLDGMTVKLSYNNGTDETVGIATALGYGVVTVPASGAALTMDDIDQKIKVSFGTLPPAYTTGKLAVAAKKVERISVTTDPTTMTYFVDGTTLPKLDLTGMVVKLTYDNGVTGENGETSVTYSEADFEKYGLTTSPVNGVDLKLTDKTITVTCNKDFAGTEKPTAQTGALSVVNKAITEIEVTTPPTKMTYIEAQPLNLDGMLLKLTFNNKEVAENVPIATALAYPYYPVVTDPIDGAALTLKEHDTAITVSSKADPAIKATTGKLTVNGKKVESISVTTDPTTMTYYVDGETLPKLDLTGMVVKLTYDNGVDGEDGETSVTYSATEFAKYGLTTVPANGDDLKLTDKTITVTCNENYAGTVKPTARTSALSVVNKAITAIEIATEPTRVSYIEGQKLDLTGLRLNITFNSREVRYDVPIATALAYPSSYAVVVNPADGIPLEKDEHNGVPIKVSAEGVTPVETSRKLAVAAKKVAGISVTQDPTKMTYSVTPDVLPTLDLTGMVVKLTYDNGVEGAEGSKLVEYSETAFTENGITVTPKHGADLTVAANNGKKLQVSCNKNTVGGAVLKAESAALSVTDATVTKVEIVSQPNKTGEYVVGQKLDLTGLTLKLTYNNEVTTGVLGYKEAASLYGVTYEPADGAVLALTNNGSGVKASVDGKEATTNALSVVAKAVSSIRVVSDPAKMVYYTGGTNQPTLDLAGMVVEKIYNDGTRETVAASDLTLKNGFDVTPEAGIVLTTANNTEIHVRYWTTDMQSVSAQTTGKLSVTARSVTGIAVRTNPTKMSYVEGQTLDLTGLSVALTYNDGGTEVVALDDFGIGITVDPGKDTVLAIAHHNKKIKVTCGDLFAETKALTVVAKKVTSIAVTKDPTKMAYYVDPEGDLPKLDLTGMVVRAAYNDGSEHDLSFVYTTDPANDAALSIDPHNGMKIKVTYQGCTAYTTGALAVSDRVIETLAMGAAPTKSLADYVEGQKLDLSGLTLEITYSGETEPETVAIEKAVKDGLVTVTPAIGTKLTVDNAEDVMVSALGAASPVNVGTLSVAAKRVSGISVVNDPVKKAYYLIDGENTKLNLSGMVVKLTYDNGTSEFVNYKMFADKSVVADPAHDSNLTAEGEPKIKVTCNEQTATTTNPITVAKKAKIAIAIEDQPNKLTYVEGQELDPSGMTLNIYYNNGDEENKKIADVLGTAGYTTTLGDDTTSTLLGKDPYILTRGDSGKAITVSVDGVGEATTANLTVTAKKITSISVTTPPTAMAYYVVPGDPAPVLDLAGMEVTLTYNSGDPKPVLYSDFGNYGITVSHANGTALSIAANNGKKLQVSCRKDTLRGALLTAESADALSVENAVITDIEIKEIPSRTPFTEGGTLELYGMKLDLTFTGGTKKSGVDWADAASLYGVTYSPDHGTTLPKPDDSETLKITASSGDVSNACDVTLVPMKVYSIKIVTPPAKTAYYLEEDKETKLDLTGLSVKLVYDNGVTEKTVKYEDFGELFTVTPDVADALTEDDIVITVQYIGTDAVDNIQPATTPIFAAYLELQGIASVGGPVELSYVEGQTLDLSDLQLKLTYNDKDMEPVTVDYDEAIARGVVMSMANGTKLTLADAGTEEHPTVIKASSGELSADIGTLKVAAKQINEIEPVTLPKLLYYIVDKVPVKPDLSALVVKLTYNNGDEVNVPKDRFAEFGITTSLDDVATVDVGDNLPLTLSCSTNTVYLITEKKIGELTVIPAPFELYIGAQPTKTEYYEGDAETSAFKFGDLAGLRMLVKYDDAVGEDDKRVEYGDESFATLFTVSILHENETRTTLEGTDPIYLACGDAVQVHYLYSDEDEYVTLGIYVHDFDETLAYMTEKAAREKPTDDAYATATINLVNDVELTGKTTRIGTTVVNVVFAKSDAFTGKPEIDCDGTFTVGSKMLTFSNVTLAGKGWFTVGYDTVLSFNRITIAGNITIDMKDTVASTASAKSKAMKRLAIMKAEGGDEPTPTEGVSITGATINGTLNVINKTNKPVTISEPVVTLDAKIAVKNNANGNVELTGGTTPVQGAIDITAATNSKGTVNVSSLTVENNAGLAIKKADGSEILNVTANKSGSVEIGNVVTTKDNKIENVTIVSDGGSTMVDPDALANQEGVDVTLKSEGDSLGVPADADSENIKGEGVNVVACSIVGKTAFYYMSLEAAVEKPTTTHEVKMLMDCLVAGDLVTNGSYDVYVYPMEFALKIAGMKGNRVYIVPEDSEKYVGYLEKKGTGDGDVSITAVAEDGTETSYSLGAKKSIDFTLDKTATYTVTAIPDDKSTFSGVSVTGKTVGTSTEFTIDPDYTGGITITATFTKKSADPGGDPVPEPVPEEVLVTGVTLAPAEVVVKATKTAQLIATVEPADATNTNVTWTTSDEKIATVSGTGLVTGVAEGKATITVTTEDGGFTATCAVTVEKNDEPDPPPPVTEITLDPDINELAVGLKKKLLLPVYEGTEGVWSVKDAKYAELKVNKKGVKLVKGLAVGDTKLTYTITAVSKATPFAIGVENVQVGDVLELTLHVRKPNLIVKKVTPTVKKLTIDMAENKVYTVAAQIKPTGAPDKALFYQSSDNTVVTVDKAGKLTPVKAGSATIRIVSTSLKVGLVKVTVIDDTQPKVVLDKEKVKIKVGGGATVQATCVNAVGAKITWSATKGAKKIVFTDNGDGSVTIMGVKAGDVELVAKADNGATATCKVTVTKAK